MSKKKLVLVDGNSIAYRAFFALPLLNNDKGVYTNAVYGFTTMLLKVLDDEAPSHMLVAFDAGKTTFRHKTFNEYKGGRQKTPPELSEQLPLIRELLDAFGIKRYELEQYEADDIIGTLSKQADPKEWDVKVITGDKDLLQLVDEHVHVALTKKGITDMDTYDMKLVEERYGLTPDQIIDMKGLMGDSSDNIPGVPGVGEKTAIKLLKEFGTIEEVLDSIDKVSGKKLKQRLEDNKEQAEMSKKLATIEIKAPVDVKLDSCEFVNEISDKVIKLFKELGFNSLLDRVDSGESEEGDTPTDEIDYEILEEVTMADFGSDAAVVIECLAENYHHGDILGMGIVSEKGKYFIPTDVALKSEAFIEWLEDEKIEKYAADAKQATVSLAWKGIDLKGVKFDALIASYLLNPSDSSHDIASIASRFGLKGVSNNETIYGKGVKQKVPEGKFLSEHIVRKANMLLQVVPRLQESLKKNEQDQLFYDLEMPLSIVLGKMEQQGVQVDVKRLEEMGTELNDQLEKIEAKIFELAGTEFNINSPKQLGEILFEKMQLPVIKKTKTGYSTSADVLEKLKDKHEIVEEILYYRQLGKLNSTYVEGLLKVVNRATEKIHTRFNQALAQTGRLSSIDPNLQNIPIRLEAGRKIRQAFIPSEKNWVVFAADYSQIELRVLAHIAQDDKLIDAFNNEMDIHTKTAMDVFHVEKDEVTSDMRRQAKAVNFGIVYGISDYGLSQSLGITRKEAGQFIERYLKSFPGVKQYMDDIVQQAKQEGYVTTMLNRRRYLPEITSRNFNLRSFAERTAMNTPIQGSAADIIKKAMVEMAKRLEKEKLKTRMLLQVHDELIFEAPKDELEKLEKIVPDVMEHAVQLDVPLKVDYSYGDTWYDAK
ncbi:DNA polymerase I [Pseudalkalibacillus salsuginis]|uniref:DNA polymerase I n=1 Tax=Pseudalkalibacillus salsuginis TaxID=2910972 RepID=UPI001F35D37E|nr:DNA polymerase I [Pseudalkalibacillus salsuginis]MCF6408740.1 DNA polymerase I [Pseudalkalibacillus salsuginis]